MKYWDHKQCKLLEYNETLQQNHKKGSVCFEMNTDNKVHNGMLSVF